MHKEEPFRDPESFPGSSWGPEANLYLCSTRHFCSFRSTPCLMGFPGGSEVKVSASNAGDPGSIHGLEISPGGGHGNPFLYSCLENPMDRGAWPATVHGVAKSQTSLSTRAHTPACSNCIVVKTEWCHASHLANNVSHT